LIEDNCSGARRTLWARALLVFIGAEANTGWLEAVVQLDERGFVLTGSAFDHSALEQNIWKRPSREPYLLELSLPGVFAASDVRSGSIKRVALAVGEGSMAVRLIHQYLADAAAQGV
jgi:thioredoxin reductase (NADPH)